MMYPLAVKKVSQFLVILLSLSATAYAQTTLKERVVRSNIQISEKIDSLAERIDLFFAGEKLTDEKNESTLRFRYFAHKAEHAKFDDAIKTDFKLRLPNTEENLSLKFTTEEDEEFDDLASRRPGAPPRRTRYGVSLGLLKKIGDFDTSFRPGIKIKDPIETSYVLSFKNRIKVKKTSASPRFDFFADSALGTGQSISLNFDYEISHAWVFLWLNEEQYLDKNNLFSTLHGPGLMYKRSDKVSYMGTLTGYSTNDPVFHLERYNLSFSRRQEIWRRILYYELSPSWAFEKDRNFKPLADFAVAIDLIF